MALLIKGGRVNSVQDRSRVIMATAALLGEDNFCPQDSRELVQGIYAF